MSKKIFSKIDKIPRGRASNKISKLCLVLEGGAFRGLYSEGVLDALMLAGINAREFDTCNRRFTIQRLEKP